MQHLPVQYLVNYLVHYYCLKRCEEVTDITKPQSIELERQLRKFSKGNSLIIELINS